MLYLNEKITRNDLASIEVPTIADLRKRLNVKEDSERFDAVGSRWAPIPHIQLVEQMTDAVRSLGLGVRSESFDLSKDGHDLCAAFELDMPEFDAGMTPTLAFRSSNLQRWALGAVAGSKVTICSNGLFAGEWNVLKHKHSSGNVERLGGLLHDGISNLEDQLQDLSLMVSRLKGTKVDDQDVANTLIASSRAGILPSQKIVQVADAYDAYTSESNPHHSEFAPRTAWSLVNAYTEVAKTMRTIPSTRVLQNAPQFVATYCNN